MCSRRFCQYPGSVVQGLIHWGRDKMADIFQATFSNAFSWMKMFEFRLKFHWSLFPRVQLTICQHCRVQIMAWRRPGDKPYYLNQLWLDYRRVYTSLALNGLTHITVFCIFGLKPKIPLYPYTKTLRWRHNDHAGVSNHQPHGCLLNRLFRRKSKKTSKLRVTGLCAGNSPGTGEFSAQMASCAENVSIWWRHHDIKHFTDPMNIYHSPKIPNLCPQKTKFSSLISITVLQYHSPSRVWNFHIWNYNYVFQRTMS